jgi:hypothetical protein
MIVLKDKNLKAWFDLWCHPRGLNPRKITGEMLVKNLHDMYVEHRDQKPEIIQCLLNANGQVIHSDGSPVTIKEALWTSEDRRKMIKQEEEIATLNWENAVLTHQIHGKRERKRLYIRIIDAISVLFGNKKAVG